MVFFFIEIYIFIPVYVQIYVSILMLYMSLYTHRHTHTYIYCSFIYFHPEVSYSLKFLMWDLKFSRIWK